MATHQLDAKGLLCPLPVLRARKALGALRSGERLEVEATDPSAEKDFAAFCDASGNKLVEMRREESVLFFLIEKR
jgi:tRNA 2-thiouridine synthesizing protein A